MATRELQQSLSGLPIQIDYTARDFDSIRSEMLKLSETLCPSWTDKEPGDIGVTILEAVAYLGDILSYNLDRVANESYLATAQTRESVMDILRLIGYELQPSSPATVTMVITTTQNNVVLPKGYKVFTEADDLSPSLVYYLTKDVTLPNSGRYCVSADSARALRAFNVAPTINDDLVFVGAEEVISTVGISNGKADQVFLLPESPVCLNADGTSSISVNIGGDVWTGKNSFLGADPTDNIFVYRILSDQTAIIEFGDGVTGAIPTLNNNIIVTYRVGGGLETNRAGIGAIDQYDFIAGVSAVTNLLQPSGGSDRETIDEAKKQAPLSLRALDRCVTLQDFEAMAKAVPGGGIRAAKAKQGESPLEVNVYIASQGTNPVPSGKWFSDIQNGYGLIGAVGRWLNQKKPIPTILNVSAPTPITPYLEATIFVHNNILRQNVEFDVDDSLQLLFFKASDDFGDGVTLSSVIQAVENTQGVDYLDVRAFYRVPAVRYIAGNESSLENSVVVVDGFTSQTQRGTYKIIWYNFNTYCLSYNNRFTTDVNGVKRNYVSSDTSTIEFYNQSNLDNEADVLTQFNLSMTLDPNHLPARGDIWEFTVDRFLDNIESKDYEIISVPIDNTGALDSTYINLTFTGGI